VRLMLRFILMVAPFIAPRALTIAEESEPPAVSFHRDVLPIFRANCQGCHQPAKSLGEYVMTTFESLVVGGESGSTAIVPGDPDKSHLLEQITPVDGQAEMPKGGEPLHETEIELVRRWIATGAVDDSPASTRKRYDQDHPPAYPRPPVITAIDHSPDGSLLAIAGLNEVLLHHADGSGLVARLIGQSERIESVRFSPDGSKLAVAGGLPAQLGELQIWNVAERALERSIAVTYDTVYGASWSPNGQHVAIGCGDTSVRVFDVISGEQIFFQGAHDDLPRDTVFTINGDYVVSVGRDMAAKLMELETERFVDNITSITPGALRGGIASVTRHPLRDEVVFGGADGVPKIYKVFRTKKRKIGDDHNQLWELPALEGRIFSVDISPDATRIAASSSLDGRGTVRVFQMEAAPEIPEEIVDILEQPTHERSAERVTQLKDFFRQGVQDLANFTIETGGIYTVSFHPDGKTVAAAGRDGIVRLIDAETGSVTKEFVPVDVQPTQVAAHSAAGWIEWESADSGEQVPEALADDAEVVGLSIEPATVQLVGRHDYVQAVVSAELKSGDVVDVTRIAQLELSSEAATVNSLGRIQPRQDGEAELTARLGDSSVSAGVRVSGQNDEWVPDFVRDINPIISKVGCNAGTCHGAQDGKGSFKLSLRGYDPLFDTRALTDDLAARRVNVALPANSLMVLKSTAAVPHQGGLTLQPGSSYYAQVLDWIAAGAELNQDTTKAVGITVFPENPIVQGLGGHQQIRVVAQYVDGGQRDVTSEAFIESGNTDVAEPVEGFSGLIKVSRRGEAPLLVRYEGSYAATTVTVMGDREGFVWQQPPINNAIDQFVVDKLKRTRTIASPLCDDYDFLRRVYLDLTGLPATPEEIRAFVSDPRDSRWKRDELIDSLVGGVEFIEHWTNKWCDLLQVNGKFLGRDGATAMRDWVRGQVQTNTPYDELVRAVITSEGSNRENPPASYYKILRSPEELVENTTHLFLATRFSCNKCHDHPFERWTQDQYYELAAFFSRVGLKKDPEGGDEMIGGTSVEAAKPLYEVVFEKPTGEVTHQRTGIEVSPSFPFECAYEASVDASRRSQLAAWITSPDNPYFARSYVNRLWGYLTGVGIIEPIDDIRAGNPPSNPRLLDWLADQFVQTGFDTRHVLRLICKSRTYQTSISTNAWNEDDSINYSHATARRLPAEVLLDAVYQVTGVQSQFAGVSQGVRAAALPDSEIKLPDGFLGSFGRPARESACECERSNEVHLGSIMALVSGPTVNDALSSAGNAVEELVAKESDDRRLIQKLFLRVLGRPASEATIEGALKITSQVNEEHRELVDTLAATEAILRPEIQQRIARRQALVEETRRSLEERQTEYAPEKAKLELEREARIQTAQVELDAYEQTIPASFVKWVAAERSSTRWHILEPTRLDYEGDAVALHREANGMVFADQWKGRGQYHVTGDVDLDTITGVRLEVFADDRLPSKGPGWAADGNFVLTEFQAWQAPRALANPTLIRRWEFADDDAAWRPVVDCELSDEEGAGALVIQRTGEAPALFAPVSADAGDYVLEIVAKVTDTQNLRLVWSTPAEPDSVDPSASVTLRMAGDGATWRRYQLFFHANEELAGLKIELEPVDKPLVIDSLSLAQSPSRSLQPLALQNAQADFSQDSFDVATAIDGQHEPDGNGWAVGDRVGVDHFAIFEIADPVIVADRQLLKVALVQKFKGKQHHLGKFRLAVTDSPRPLGLGHPPEIGDLLAIDDADRTEEQTQQLMDYYRRADQSLVDHQNRLAESKTPVPEDPKTTELQARLELLEKPLPEDPRLVRLRRDVELSREQLTNQRLVAAQDIVWGLINSPAFLFNH